MGEDSGKRGDGRPRPWAREVSGGAGVRWLVTLGELLSGGHRGVSADTLGAHPHEARWVTLGGMGVRPDGQAVWGASQSVWILGQSLGFPIRTIWLFGFLPMFRMAHPPGTCRGPSVRRAGWHDRPRGHASPVARAPKPRASRLLVGPHAGGLHWRQEWGEVNLQPPDSLQQP